MASRLLRFAVLLLPVIGLFQGCHDKLESICDRIHLCDSFVVPKQCKEDLTEAINDGRLTQQRAIICTACLQNNLDGDQCDAVIKKRNCDVACTGINAVTQMFTTAQDRTRACVDVSTTCSPSPVPSTCSASLDQVLEINPSLDQDLHACVDCILAQKPCTPASVQTPLDNRDAGCADAGAQQSILVCQDYMSACGSACSTFRAFTDLFKSGQSIAGICNVLAGPCTSDGGKSLGWDKCIVDVKAAIATDAGVHALRTDGLRNCAACLGTRTCDQLYACSTLCGTLDVGSAPKPRDAGRD